MGRRVLVSVALPALFVCTLAREPFSVGGGPPGGVRAASGPPTATAYGDCGPGGPREQGLQGQVSLAEQRNGASRQGARCNFTPVGENSIKSRGANFQLAWFKDCAYVGSVGSRELLTLRGDNLDGVAVLDVSAPAKPELTTILQGANGISQHEAIEVSEQRGMLVVENGGLVAEWIDVYDISKDCRHPVHMGRYDAGSPKFHGLEVSPDGKTIYATDFTGAYSALGGVMDVVDVSDMSRPRLMMRWDFTQEGLPPAGVHDLDVSDDGRRLYLGVADPSADLGALVAGPPSNTGITAAILDVSDIQDRRPDPDPKIVSTIKTENFGHTEQLARIGGKQYLITSGETPFVGPKNCPWAWGNIVDIGDERAPKVVSELRLAVNDQAQCATVGSDDAVYSIHYIGVDDPDDTKMVFYTYYTGGLRVFDVRDPAHPKEIAYYHPPPVDRVAHQPLPGVAGDYQEPLWDSATSNVRYFPQTGQAWFVSIGRGFQVVQLTAPAGGLRCTPRDAVTITLPRGLKSATVSYAGRNARVRRSGGRLRARIVLRADVVSVRINGRAHGGRRVTQRRVLRRCR